MDAEKLADELVWLIDEERGDTIDFQEYFYGGAYIALNKPLLKARILNVILKEMNASSD